MHRPSFTRSLSRFLPPIPHRDWILFAFGSELNSGIERQKPFRLREHSGQTIGFSTKEREKIHNTFYSPNRTVSQLRVYYFFCPSIRFEYSSLFAHVISPSLSSLFQVEIEGLTGEIRFNEDGRRQNYTLAVVEMTVNSGMVKVAEWSDQTEFMPITSKYHDNSQPRIDYERNRTYVITTILEEPYIMLRKGKPGLILEGNDLYEGYCKDLAELIARKLGINCKWPCQRTTPMRLTTANKSIWIFFRCSANRAWCGHRFGESKWSRRLGRNGRRIASSSKLSLQFFYG